MAKDDDELNAATLKVLYSFTEFEQFKAMMLLRKRSKSAAEGTQEVVAKEVHLDEELDGMVSMMHDGVWKTLLKKPDLVVEMARNSKGIDTVRCTVECGMPRANALDMWTNATSERKH